MKENLTAKLSDGTEWRVYENIVDKDGWKLVSLEPLKPKKIEAPERIFRWTNSITGNTFYSPQQLDESEIEYIRADLVEKQREKRKPIERWVLWDIKNNGVWCWEMTREEAESDRARRSDPEAYSVVCLREVVE